MEKERNKGWAWNWMGGDGDVRRLALLLYPMPSSFTKTYTLVGSVLHTHMSIFFTFFFSTHLFTGLISISKFPHHHNSQSVFNLFIAFSPPKRKNPIDLFLFLFFTLFCLECPNYVLLNKERPSCLYWDQGLGNMQTDRSWDNAISDIWDEMMILISISPSFLCGSNISSSSCSRESVREGGKHMTIYCTSKVNIFDMLSNQNLWIN